MVAGDQVLITTMESRKQCRRRDARVFATLIPITVLAGKNEIPDAIEPRNVQRRQ